MITYRHAPVILQQTFSLQNDALARFEQALLESTPHRTASNLKHTAHTTREHLHPESIKARHQKSVSDHLVTFEPETDGVATLPTTLTTPSKNKARWRNPHPPDGTTQRTKPTGRTFNSEPATAIHAPWR